MKTVSSNTINLLANLLLLALKTSTILAVTLAVPWKTEDELESTTFAGNNLEDSHYTFTETSDTSPETCGKFNLSDITSSYNLTDPKDPAKFLAINIDTSNSDGIRAVAIFEESDGSCERDPWLIVKVQPHVAVQGYELDEESSYRSFSTFFEGINADEIQQFEDGGVPVVDAEDVTLTGYEDAVAANVKTNPVTVPKLSVLQSDAEQPAQDQGGSGNNGTLSITQNATTPNGSVVSSNLANSTAPLSITQGAVSTNGTSANRTDTNSNGDTNKPDNASLKDDENALKTDEQAAQADKESAEQDEQAAKADEATATDPAQIEADEDKIHKDEDRIKADENRITQDEAKISQDEKEEGEDDDDDMPDNVEGDCCGECCVVCEADEPENEPETTSTAAVAPEPTSSFTVNNLGEHKLSITT